MADEDVILADNDIHQLGRADWVHGVGDCGRGDQPGSGSQMGICSLDWEEQYQKMSLDDRLQLELSSIGMLPVQPVSKEIRIENGDQMSMCHCVVLQSSDFHLLVFPLSVDFLLLCGSLSPCAIKDTSGI